MIARLRAALDPDDRCTTATGLLARVTLLSRELHRRRDSLEGKAAAAGAAPVASPRPRARQVDYRPLAAYCRRWPAADAEDRVLQRLRDGVATARDDACAGPAFEDGR